VIGGGGGGGGGSECCTSLKSLTFSFRFRAEIKPPDALQRTSTPRKLSPFPKAICCPNLTDWSGVVMRSIALDNNTKEGAPRQLGVPGTGFLPPSITESGRFGKQIDVTVDPFAMENTGTQAPGGENRPPDIKEMVQQHQDRLGTNATEIIKRLEEPKCALPTWLTNVTELRPRVPRKEGPYDSNTKESEFALKYIIKFNPLQGYLAEGAATCDGWGDWCCVCHQAQMQIACLPEQEQSKVGWFIIEDCCESKMQRNTSSPGFVAEVAPSRNTTLAWRPGTGWVHLERKAGVSDSYAWNAQIGPSRTCLAQLHNLEAYPEIPVEMLQLQHGQHGSQVTLACCILGAFCLLITAIVFLLKRVLRPGFPQVPFAFQGHSGTNLDSTPLCYTELTVH